ncbi:hypothetical protein BN1051_02719 [Arthrobacter saudimassiliensis]|uniref:Uncharacterized protein n=1 Tax=Arthrobacter saudimassiliensis TaxID=1461584 RepID=A0A078MWZ9_9MICC|nr:hypothetical protein BN1051_02719 [Arthrobacter saudimassiliensis]
MSLVPQTPLENDIASEGTAVADEASESLSPLVMAASRVEVQQWELDRAEQALAEVVQDALEEGTEPEAVAQATGLTTNDVDRLLHTGSLQIIPQQ